MQMKTQIDTEAKGLKYEVIAGLCNITPTFSFVLTVTEQAKDKKKWLNWYTAYMEYFSLRKDHNIPSHFPKLNTLRIPLYFNLPQ